MIKVTLGHTGSGRRNESDLGEAGELYCSVLGMWVLATTCGRLVGCTVMICALDKYVLLQAKFSKSFKSRWDHSISFKNRSVTRTTAIELNESFPVSGYQTTQE